MAPGEQGRKGEKMFKKLMLVSAFVVVVGGLSVARVAAQSSVGKDEKALCLKTINDLTNGKPPPSAVKLCSEGKTEEAVKKAMAAQGG